MRTFMRVTAVAFLLFGSSLFWIGEDPATLGLSFGCMVIYALLLTVSWREPRRKAFRHNRPWTEEALAAKSLTPMVFWIGPTAITHGERGREMDADNPDACLCGYPEYLFCPDAFGPGSLINTTWGRA